MKKCILWFLVLATLLFSGCSQNPEEVPSSSTAPSSSRAVSSSRDVSSAQSMVEVFPESDAVRGQAGTYISETMGFQITFPESWKDYYFIEEKTDNEGAHYIQVFFYGQSKYGKYACDYDLERSEIIYTNGLIIFSVSEEKGGDPTLLGYVGDKALYLNEPTDMSLPFDIDPSTSDYQWVVENYPEDPEGYVQDGRKAKEMRDTIDQIVASFQPLR